MKLPSKHSLPVAAITALATLALGTSVRAQQAGPAEVERQAEALVEQVEVPILAVLLEGLVLGPDGAPAPGAVVVSSAGGKAVTDDDGVYQLEVQVPLEAESAQVTAIQSKSGGNLTASTGVLLAASGTTRVGPLVLALSTTCQPSWLPTFGAFPGVTGTVRCLAVFDDGSGPALYEGGDGSARLDKWNGSSWVSTGFPSAPTSSP